MEFFKLFLQGGQLLRYASLLLPFNSAFILVAPAQYDAARYGMLRFKCAFTLVRK